jgi:hypothetical protein
MATVPGDPTVPDNVVDLVPKHLQPTQGDFLMAAAIMDRQRPSGSAEGVMAKPGQTVQPVDVGGNIAKVREEFGRAAAEMTGVADAVRAVRGEMTPEEAQTFALGAIPALVPGGKVAGEAAEVAPGVMRGIRAFHGSPYDFERFSMAKVGTGEGAQAYGHGLYFAENPTVSETYKDMARQEIGSPEYYAQLHLNRASGDAQSAMGSLFKAAQDSLGDVSKERTEAMYKAITLVDQGWKPQAGKMYEVNINADPEHFLDWDKPLSAQPGILQKLEPILSGQAFKEAPGQTGEDFIGKFGITQRADLANELRQAGIPGIKYLDQGSRNVQDMATLKARLGALQATSRPTNAGLSEIRDIQNQIANYKQPTHNYVVFDDKLIDIIKKYGIAGLITANVAHFKTGAGNGNGSE